MVKKSTKRKRSTSSGGSKPKKQRFSQAKNVGAITKKNAVEWKNIDVGTAVTTVGGGSEWSILTFLNPVPQGTNSSQRIGRKLAMNRLHFRWVKSQTVPAAATDVGQYYPIRLLLVYDRSPQGALPLITDILSNAGFESHVNLDNSDRFIILRDMIVQEEQQFSAQLHSGKISLKFPQGLLCQWDNVAGGTIADITAGAIYFAYAMTGLPGATKAISVAFNSRIRYSDA